MTAEQKLELIKALQDVAYEKMQDIKHDDTGSLLDLYADLAEAIDFVLFVETV